MDHDTITITGIHLVRTGNKVEVMAEMNGKWVVVITEGADGPFSHIVEPAGMRKCYNKAFPGG